MPALEEIGREWESGELSLAEVYLAGKVSAQAIEELVPQGGEAASIAVCVLDDYHTLGKSLVLASLRTARIAADDLGVITVEGPVQRMEERPYRALFVSTLMLRSALRVEDLVKQLAQKGLATRVVVGGAPFRMDPLLAGRVGAHACGVSAPEAVRIARAIVAEEGA